MKKLMRMKLINWHRFSNTTININGSVLISGENGAGKSTLLDAIQFVVTCSANSFNKAAHEYGKRKLTGYVRCKSGKENNPFERVGEISAHIALEFYEESKEKYFIVGAVIDSSSEGQEKSVWYLFDEQRFTDDMFLNGFKPKSIEQFRISNTAKIRQWCKTQKDAKSMIKSRFGRIDEKFFSLIPKAMVFKPINDIKDFVYSYVLDEKEVNIDVLRENVRTYQDLERTLNGVKLRLNKLGQIAHFHDEVVESIRKDNMYEYFLAQAELDITKGNIREAEERIKDGGFRLKDEEIYRAGLINEKDEKEEIEKNLLIELNTNEEYIALKEQMNKLKAHEDKEKDELNEKAVLMKSVRFALDKTYKLQTVEDVDNCIIEYQKTLQKIESIEDISSVKSQIEQVISYKREMNDKLKRKKTELELALEKDYSEKQVLNLKRERLEKKQLSYPTSVNVVLEAIKDEFTRIGREPEPHILCELLEIADESWRNAVEGYLNTQRFYILVTPEHFDIALGIYDKLRKNKKAYGVGLINTGKLDEYDTPPPDSLATVVTSKNIYARRFANMILGKVHMCKHYDELKRYPTAITKECMKYQNRVASAIKPEIFEVPFIGKNAFKVQLELTKKKLTELDIIIKDKEKSAVEINAILESLSYDDETDIKFRLDALIKLRQTQNAIKICKANIKKLETDDSYIEKNIKIEELRNQRKELDDRIGRSNVKSGSIEKSIDYEKAKKEQYHNIESECRKIVLEISDKAKDDVPAWKSEYDKLLHKKSLSDFKENYSRQRKTNDTQKNKAEDRMSEIMIQYKMEHDFGAPANIEGYPEFAAVHERLRTSELLDYEEKVQNAKIAAEEEFREQFLSKLQENIKQAQIEFKELNKALKDIRFSNEKYEFLYMASRKYRNYYDMIMDDFNALQGTSIFSGLYLETHKEVIEELFTKLALDQENGEKALKEFTDYRTYMDYDIKIVHTDGEFSFYSKVCEEKSGGETQTPFYVTVAASFMQLYNNNIGGEAIGLVMFDEAFNNMDDERIGGVLEFFSRLPLQIMIAAPPDKIQYICPVVNQTLLVMTDEKMNYIEEYRHDKI